MTQVKLGDKNIPFIYQGNELLYPNPIKDGLVLYYDFKGMTNGNIHKEIAEDLSGTDNNGRLNNFSYTNESGYNNGLNLDGVDDYIKVENKHENIYNSKSLTIEMTIEFLETPDNWRWLISNSVDSIGSKGFSIAYSINSPAGIAFRTGGNSVDTGIQPKTGDKFHIIALFFENRKMRTVINGQIINNNTALKDLDISPLNISIGKASYYQSPHLKSSIKNVRIYNRALTDEEIQHNYQLEKERWGL